MLERVHNQQRLVDMNLPDAEAAEIAHIAAEEGVNFDERLDRLRR
jgi:hypothetical protein